MNLPHHVATKWSAFRLCVSLSLSQKIRNELTWPSDFVEMPIYIQAVVSHYVQKKYRLGGGGNMTLRKRNLSVENSFTGAARRAYKTGERLPLPVFTLQSYRASYKTTKIKLVMADSFVSVKIIRFKILRWMRHVMRPQPHPPQKKSYFLPCVSSVEHKVKMMKHPHSANWVC